MMRETFMDSLQVGQKLLTEAFAEDELSFLLTYECFAAAAPRAVTLEDGQQPCAQTPHLIITGLVFAHF